MNSICATKKSPDKKIPTWLNWLLILLLLALSLAGYFFYTLQTQPPAAEDAESSRTAILPKPDESKGFTIFRDISGATQIEIVCQGMGVGKDNVARAVIDGKIVKPGDILRDMKILEISVGSLLVECNGKRLRLSPGESITPNRH